MLIPLSINRLIVVLSSFYVDPSYQSLGNVQSIVLRSIRKLRLHFIHNQTMIRYIAARNAIDSGIIKEM